MLRHSLKQFRIASAGVLRSYTTSISSQSLTQNLSLPEARERFKENPRVPYYQAQYLSSLLHSRRHQQEVVRLYENDPDIVRGGQNLEIYMEALRRLSQSDGAFSVSHGGRASQQAQPSFYMNNVYHSNVSGGQPHIPPSSGYEPSHQSATGQQHRAAVAPGNMTKEELSEYLQENLVLLPRRATFRDRLKDNKHTIGLLVAATIALGFLYYFSNAQGSDRKSMNPFMTSSTGHIVKQTGKYFDDVKGIDECKEELMDVVDFLKYPEKYRRFGARIPKGVLLVGPPGTGKTLLAKAVAQEAGVKFVSTSGSEFDQAFVGMGASRIRSLFSNIGSDEKAVIFIDEIDSIARNRNASRTYHQQTLNEFLTQLDGFSSNQNIVVIGATNASTNELDPALMRPGRFDKVIDVPLPDSFGRKEIVDYYLKKRKVQDKVDLDLLSRSTIGMTGAEIENCVNQAAIHAVRKGRQLITMEDIDFGIDRQRMGVELSKREIHEEDRRITAYHEAGHALVSHLLGTELNRVHKITIIPRGPAGGYTSFVPSSDVELMPTYQIMKQIKTAFGGRVAEEILLGPDNVTAGASGDLQQATQLAKTMVTTQGMSELGTQIFDARQLGEDTLEKVDGEVLRILTDCRQTVREMLNDPKNKAALDRIATALLEYETISGEEMNELLEGREIVRTSEGIRFTPRKSQPEAPEDPLLDQSLSSDTQRSRSEL